MFNIHMEEVWKPVAGYEGLYEVSNLGRVMSLEKKLKRTDGKMCKRSSHLLRYFNNGGYCRVSLFKNGESKKYLVHRLVATAFIPNPMNYTDVNHKDCVKTNNTVWNLEWCDRLYNNTYEPTLKKRIETALKNGKKRQRVAKIDSSGKVIEEYRSQTECAQKNGISKGDLCCLLNNYYGRKTIGGYKYIKI